MCGALITCKSAGDGKMVLLDVEEKSPEKILSELTAIAGKTE